MTLFRQTWFENSKGAVPEPLGVIDIGSNSVRLVVYEGAPGAITPLFNEKILCGLGRGVSTRGRLDDKAVERALAALARFRALSQRLNAREISAVATAAVREASNGGAFITKAQDICGVTIDVLTGEREAELAAHGVMMGFGDPNGIAGDLGGGSLELIDIMENRLSQAVSLPLGGLRLIDKSGGNLEKCGALIDREFDRLSWIDSAGGRPFYCVGGTWRALAKLHMSSIDYPLHITQGYTLPTEEAMAFARSVYMAKKLSDLRGIRQLSKARREVLPYGAYLLERLLSRMKPSEVVFSVFGLREGLLYEMMSPQQQAVDPLLGFCEHFAKIRSRSVEHAHELCRWTDRIFQLPGPSESAEERRLRHAACLISDIGWRRHPDYQADQVPGMVAYAGMSGVTHHDRMFLALSIYHRHMGVGNGADGGSWAGLKDRISERALNRARIVGAGVRCAHMLSAGMPGVIDDTPLSFEDENLVLTIPAEHAVLDGERMRRRFSVLAGLLSKEPVVRVG